MENFLRKIWKELILVLVAGFSWMFLIFGGFISVMFIFLWYFHVWKVFSIRIYPMMSFNDFFRLTHMWVFLAMLVLGFFGVYLLDWRNPGKYLESA